MAGTLEDKPTLGRLMCKDGEWLELSDASLAQREAIAFGLLRHEGKYLMADRFGRWVKITESDARRNLKCTSKLPGEEIDHTMDMISMNHNVDFVGPLAGYPIGVYPVGSDQKFLVNSELKLIEPDRKGSCASIRSFVEQLLGPVQVQYFYSWLHAGVESLRTHDRSPGHGVAFVGDKGVGKNLLQDCIITPIFGGRDSKPHAYMSGKTNFNDDLFAGEHLIIQDEVPFASVNARRNFGVKMKEILVNPRQWRHPKGKTPYMVSPFWRLTISTNEEHISILPPLDESIGEKIMLFKVAKTECLPGDFQERKQFIEKMKSELPAFMAFVQSFVIPEDIRDPRYRVKAYHHPSLIEQIESMSEATILLNLIDMECFSGLDDEWEGTATELHKKLANSPRNSSTAREILNGGVAHTGRYLQELSRRKNARVTSRILDGRTIYTIQSPDTDM